MMHEKSPLFADPKPIQVQTVYVTERIRITVGSADGEPKIYVLAVDDNRIVLGAGQAKKLADTLEQIGRS
jgi:hypothetical protein